jgi:hypothetical protein
LKSAAVARMVEVEIADQSMSSVRGNLTRLSKFRAMSRCDRLVIICAMSKKGIMVRSCASIWT